jgi:hypothetical protein
MRIARIEDDAEFPDRARGRRRSVVLGLMAVK